jgi:phage FluMu protein gp41
MAALTKVGSKIIGPLSPKEFSDLSTLQTTINTAIQAVSDASATNAVLGTECITVLGNTFLVVLYQLA